MLWNLSTWTRRELGAAVILLAATTATAQTAFPTHHTDLTPAQIREDLTFLLTQWAPLDKSFTDEQRGALNHVVNDAMAAADTLSTEDFALDVMRAVAIPRNGHTAALVGRLLHDLPVRAWWFADGFYIVSAEPSFAELLGARIEKFGVLMPDEALARIAPFISGTDQRIRYLSAAFLTSPAVLKRIGTIGGNTEIPLTLRLRDSTVRVVNLEPTATPDPGDRHNPVFSGYSVLIPDAADLPGRWLHVLDGVQKRPPIYTKPTDVTASWFSEDHQILYLRSNTIDSLDQTPLGRKLTEILRMSVITSRPKAVIVDLRLNNGGDFFNTILFAQALPRLMPPEGHIFALVSRATFSAALVTVAMLKGAGQGQVTIVGETMGDDGHFWAEGGVKTLPNSHITLHYSDQFEDYEKGCTDPGTCYWATVAFGPHNISLAPDVKVDVTFADYASGRDPVLDAASAK